MSIQSDIRKLLSETGISQQELAKMAGVNPAALCRFLNREGRSIAERLVPFVYGEKKLLSPFVPTATPTSTTESGEEGSHA